MNAVYAPHKMAATRMIALPRKYVEARSTSVGPDNMITPVPIRDIKSPSHATPEIRSIAKKAAMRAVQMGALDMMIALFPADVLFSPVMNATWYNTHPISAIKANDLKSVCRGFQKVDQSFPHRRYKRADSTTAAAPSLKTFMTCG